MGEKRKDFTVNKRIREWRESIGLTQAELATKLDEKTSYIKALDNNQYTPAIDFIMKVHRILHVDYDYLMKPYANDKEGKKAGLTRVKKVNKPKK